MIQFTSHEEHHPPKKKGGHEGHGGDHGDSHGSIHDSYGHDSGLEDSLSGNDVGNHALRIAMEQHRKAHEKRGEDVEIKVHEKKGLSEEQESIVNELKRADKHANSKEKDAYKAITAETITGNYGASAASGAYGHSHGSAEAACSCGNWTMTSSQAMHEFMPKDEKKKGNSMYAGNSDESGGNTLYNQINKGGEDLEAAMHSYSSPVQSQYH